MNIGGIVDRDCINIFFDNAPSLEHLDSLPVFGHISLLLFASIRLCFSYRFV
jgi:hypothetical protein